MNLQQTARRTTVNHERHVEADTRLHGRWLLLARIVWLALVILTLSVYLASLSEKFAQQQTICFGTACAFWQLTPATVQALHSLSFSVSGYATFDMLLTVASTLLCVA